MFSLINQSEKSTKQPVPFKKTSKVLLLLVISYLRNSVVILLHRIKKLQNPPLTQTFSKTLKVSKIS